MAEPWRKRTHLPTFYTFRGNLDDSYSRQAEQRLPEMNHSTDFGGEAGWRAPSVARVPIEPVREQTVDRKRSRLLYST